MPKRFKIRFRDAESLAAAQSVAAVAGATFPPRHLREFEGLLVQVRNDKRYYLSVEQSQQSFETKGEKGLDRQMHLLIKEFDADVVEDFRYDLDADVFDPAQFGPDDPNNPSLDEVLNLINAPRVWNNTTGEKIAIAIVDTGIDGTRPEFPASRRIGEWQPIGEQPWTDSVGHGTMCATIAAASRNNGGRFEGVAPGTSLICCKTGFYDSELAAIYDYLTNRVQTEGLKIVATNSFGASSGTAPPTDPDSDFLPALHDAISAGIVVFFSAGNNHDYAGGKPDDCAPNTVWLHKSRSDVMTVATCDMDLKMWYYSSRGPGQHYGDLNTNAKPDVTAPTPRNGRILYGNNVRSLPNGWGTSGACPQAAGLAALLLSANSDLSREQVFETIRSTSTPLGVPIECSGAGIIDCRVALDSVLA